MKRLTKISLLSAMALIGGSFFSGCDNMTVGIGVSNYNPSTGMSYSYGVSQGPYGTQQSMGVGYSSGGYYGGGYRGW
jgi:hypothetical protein